VARDRVQAGGGVSRPSATDGLTRDPEQVGDVGFAESEFATVQSAEAEGLENLIGQLASVR
jgi:hypothetical protein